MTNLKYIFFGFFSSLIISLILTPVVINIAHKRNWVVAPKADRWHKKPTAVRGGIAMFLAIIIPLAVFNFRYTTIFSMIPLTLMFFTGLVDDALTIKPIVKLVMQLISLVFVIISGYTFGAGLLSIFSIVLTIFWVVGITNSINLLDNMDGLATGITLIISFFIGLIAARLNDFELATISFIVSGSCLGFLFFNFYPAKIFMGDSGSLLLGFLISYLAMALQKLLLNYSNALVFLIPIGLLSVPLIDTSLVTLRRLLSGRRIDQGGRDHLSHRLVSLGFTETKAVLLLYLVAIIWGVNTLLLGYVDISVLIISTLLLTIFTVVFAITLSEIRVYSDPEENLAYKRIRGIQLGKASFVSSFIANRKKILGIFGDVIIIGSSFYISKKITGDNITNLFMIMLLFISVKLVIFYLFKHYDLLWRYTSSSDLVKYFVSILLASIFLVVILRVVLNVSYFNFLFILIDFFITLGCIIYFRISYKFINEIMVGDMNGKKRTLLYGAGDFSYIFLKELSKNKALDFKVVGFIDDDQTKQKKLINGIKVLGPLSEIEKFIELTKPEVVLVSSEKIDESKKIMLKNILDQHAIKFGCVSINITDNIEKCS